MREWLTPLLLAALGAVVVSCGDLPGGAAPREAPREEEAPEVTGPVAGTPLRVEGTITDRFHYVEGFGEGALWVSDYGDYRCSGDCVAPQKTFLRALDTKTGEASAGIPLEGADVEVAFGAGAVWVASGRGVLRIEPGSGRVTRNIPLKYAGGAASGVAFGEGAVWAVGVGDGALSRIDPLTNTVTARVDVGDGGPAANAMAVGEGAVWVGTRNEGLARVDPSTNRLLGVSRIEENVADGEASDVSDVAVGAGAVWTAGSYGDWTSGFEGKLTKVDPRTGEVVGEVTLGERAWEVEVTRQAVWAAGSSDPGAPGGPATGVLARVDPGEGRLVGSLRARSLSGPVAGGGSVWASSSEHGDPPKLLELSP